MEKIENKIQELQIQGLVDRFLKLRNFETSADRPDHLDEDTLAAFVEGTLNRREATPVVSHLVNCSFCRHITTELVRLDMAFAEEAAPLMAEAKEPSRVSDVLNNLISKIFGTSDQAVFAHSEDEKEDEKEPKDTE